MVLANLPETPNFRPHNLRIKTPDKMEVVSYDDMKIKLKEDGNFVFDKILIDDRERSVCIYENEGTKFVLKLGNHADHGDTTKFKLLRHEDKIYMDLKALPTEKQKYFPKVYDAGSVDDKFYYIIMEFVEGITLYDYINQAYKSGIFRPKEEVITILLNLTKALNAMYSLGIIHGDLSVENVMIESGGNVKLIDFEKSSTDIKLETNTYGTTGIDITSNRIEGVGYYFLIVKTLDIIKNKLMLKQLVKKIQNKIETCSKDTCKNFYDECEKLLGAELQTGGKRKSIKKVSRKRRQTTRR